MSTPDYSDMARQFMDMWQQNMSRAMSDQGFVQAMMDGMRPHTPQKAHEQHTTHRQSAAASKSRDEQLDELTGRLRVLERRVRELEQQLDQRDAAAPTPARKPTAKKAIRKRAVKPADKPKRAAGTTKSSTKRTKR